MLFEALGSFRRIQRPWQAEILLVFIANGVAKSCDGFRRIPVDWFLVASVAHRQPEIEAAEANESVR